MCQDYFIAADGSWAPAIFVSGYLPANQFIDIVAPRIADIDFTSGGSGQLIGGYSYYFCFVIYDAAGRPSRVSNLSAIWIPPTNPPGNQVKLTIMPPVSGTWSGWELFAGLDRRTLARQDGGSGMVPNTYVFNGP